MMIMMKVIVLYKHNDDNCTQQKMMKVMINLCNDNDYLEQKKGKKQQEHDCLTHRVHSGKRAHSFVPIPLTKHD